VLLVFAYHWLWYLKNDFYQCSNIDKIPLKNQPHKEADLKRWSHLDLIKDTIPGMSVDKAYAELLKNKKG
jgi:hypothetical protein